MGGGGGIGMGTVFPCFHDSARVFDGIRRYCIVSDGTQSYWILVDGIEWYMKVFNYTQWNGL